MRIETCEETMRADCASDDEIEQEMSVINSQYAYLCQTTGREQTSIKLYDQILDSKYIFLEF